MAKIIAIITLLYLATISTRANVLDSNFKFHGEEKHCKLNWHIDCDQSDFIKPVLPIRYKQDVQGALLTTADQAWQARINSIINAKKTIYIQALLFQGDEVGFVIASLLKEKRAQGIDVKIIIDAVSNSSDLKAQKLYADLEQNGIQILGYGPLFSHLKEEFSILDPGTINNRFHDKLWIVDGEFAIVGGRNIGNEYFQADPQNIYAMWRDQDIALKGQIVQDIESVFQRNYKYFQRRAELKSATLPEQILKLWNKYSQNNNHKIDYKHKVDLDIVKSLYQRGIKKLKLNFTQIDKARFIQSRPRYDEHLISQTYVDMINRAKKEIIISNAYFIPIKEIKDALIKASARGVEISIMTNSRQNNDLPLISDISRTFYFEFQQLNFVSKNPTYIYEWNGGEYAFSTNHAKYAIFDQEEVILGSFNLDPRSENLNSETVIAFKSSHLAQEMATTFFISDLARSNEIDEYQSAKMWNDGKDLLKLRLKKLMSGQF